MSRDLQDGGHVVEKMGISPNFWNLENAVKNAYFGTFHTFNIFHGKTLDPKCGRNNIWKYFRQTKFDHHPEISTYDVILAQNDVILTQNGQISHKMTYFDVFYPFNDFRGQLF